MSSTGDYGRAGEARQEKVSEGYDKRWRKRQHAGMNAFCRNFRVMLGRPLVREQKHQRCAATNALNLSATSHSFHFSHKPIDAAIPHSVFKTRSKYEKKCIKSRRSTLCCGSTPPTNPLGSNTHPQIPQKATNTQKTRPKSNHPALTGNSARGPFDRPSPPSGRPTPWKPSRPRTG